MTYDQKMLYDRFSSLHKETMALLQQFSNAAGIEWRSGAIEGRSARLYKSLDAAVEPLATIAAALHEEIAALHLNG